MIQKILIDKNLSSNEKIVLMYLIENMVNSKIDIPFKSLGEELGLAVPTVVKIIKSLTDKNLVIKKQNYYNGIVIANTYTVNLNKYI